jgi:hypothetical protein
MGFLQSGFVDHSTYAGSFTEAERAHAVETLREWFHHDTWTLREGLFLLAGIDPYRSDDLICIPGGVTTAPSPSWARITKRPGVKVDAAGVPSPDGLILDVWALRELWELLRLWHSNPAHSTDWSSRAAPAYYVRWAIAKERAPYWFDWLPEQRRVSIVGPEGAPGEPVPQPQAPNAKRWTRERTDEARALVARLKTAGERAPTQKAAKHFGVSAARLREVFRANPEPIAAGAHWPSSATKLHRSK